ncbi:MAG: bifunctional nuclease family protein [Acidimicrobiia bacterium]
MAEPVAVDLVGVRIQLPSQSPIVLLKEREGTRHVPIWIGAVEATAIAYAMEGVVPERPLTHDLFAAVLGELDVRLERVVVTDLADQVFFADLVLQWGDEVRVVSSRPSDAIALAARVAAPLFVSPEVLDEVGIELRDEDEEDEIERFREFLDEIDPEDFSS